MDIGDMDVEDFQRAWRGARRAWDQINQRKLEREASGLQLTGQEQADWLQAKARFEPASNCGTRRTRRAWWSWWVVTTKTMPPGKRKGALPCTNAAWLTARCQAAYPVLSLAGQWPRCPTSPRPHLPRGVRAAQAQGKITPAGLAS